MAFNLLKIYNQLLELFGTEMQIRTSLRGVFNKDFMNQEVKFNGKEVYPTPRHDGEIPMDTLFRHLTTEVIDKKTKERAFELQRSLRLHWVKHHLLQRKTDNMMLFSVKEPDGNRTYYYDMDEQYVVVLEPQRNGVAYYLLTAYPVRGRDGQRNKIEKKYKRKLDDVL